MFGRDGSVGRGHGTVQGRGAQEHLPPEPMPGNQAPVAPAPPDVSQAVPAMQATGRGRGKAVIATATHRAQHELSMLAFDMRSLLTGKRLTKDDVPRLVARSAMLVKSLAGGADRLAVRKRQELQEYLGRRLVGVDFDAVEGELRKQGRSLLEDLSRLEEAMESADQGSEAALKELEVAFLSAVETLHAAGIIQDDVKDALSQEVWVGSPNLSFQFEPLRTDMLTKPLEKALTMIMTFPGEGSLEARRIEEALGIIESVHPAHPATIQELRRAEELIASFAAAIDRASRDPYVTHEDLQGHIARVLCELARPLGLDRAKMDQLFMLVIPPVSAVGWTIQATFEIALSEGGSPELDAIRNRYEQIRMKMQDVDVDQLARSDMERGEPLRILLGQLNHYVLNGHSEDVQIRLMTQILPLMNGLLK